MFWKKMRSNKLNFAVLLIASFLTFTHAIRDLVRKSDGTYGDQMMYKPSSNVDPASNGFRTEISVHDFKYFGTESNINVHFNGFVTFNELSTQQLSAHPCTVPVSHRVYDFIAAYWTKYSSGSVYHFRNGVNADTITAIENDLNGTLNHETIQVWNPHYSGNIFAEEDFKIKNIDVITWFQMKRDSNSQQDNTFQIALVESTNGYRFAKFYFKKLGITYNPLHYCPGYPEAGISRKETNTGVLSFNNRITTTSFLEWLTNEAPYNDLGSYSFDLNESADNTPFLSARCEPNNNPDPKCAPFFL